MNMNSQVLYLFSAVLLVILSVSNGRVLSENRLKRDVANPGGEIEANADSAPNNAVSNGAPVRAEVEGENVGVVEKIGAGIGRTVGAVANGVVNVVGAAGETVGSVAQVVVKGASDVGDSIVDVGRSFGAAVADVFGIGNRT